MKYYRYAIYDLKTGRILQTHQEVDKYGRGKELSEKEVLSVLPAHIDRSTVGVAALEGTPQSRTHLRVDPQTRKVVSA